MGSSIKKFLLEDEGQGTVEYAILVGMLVVVAIGVIVVVSGKMKPIWESIQKAFESLSPQS